MNEMFLTQEQVCEIVRVNRITLWRWVRSGRFPQPVRLGVRRIFWLKPVVEQFLQMQNEEFQFKPNLSARHEGSEFVDRSVNKFKNKVPKI